MDAVVEFVQAELSAFADRDKAAQMAAYMKTDTEFYGIPSPQRRAVLKELKSRFAPTTAGECESMVRALWALPHREEKYMAIDVARAYRRFITFDQLDLCQHMIVDGAWWDLVDIVASNLVGKIVLEDRERMRPILDDWIDGDDMWLRRTAIICHLGHKEQTDWAMLNEYCLRRAHEKEFFIRKAIGWALRQYARTDPETVTAFLIEHKDKLSGLSFREASKHLSL